MKDSSKSFSCRLLSMKDGPICPPMQPRNHLEVKFRSKNEPDVLVYRQEQDSQQRVTEHMMNGVVYTYPAVPAGLVEMWVMNSGVSLEIPKSATLAIRNSSRRMLLGFMSLCITGGSCTKRVSSSSEKFLLKSPNILFLVHGF